MTDSPPTLASRADAALAEAEARLTAAASEAREATQRAFAASGQLAATVIEEAVRAVVVTLRAQAEAARSLEPQPSESLHQRELVSAEVGAVLAVSTALQRAMNLERQMFLRRLGRAEARVAESLGVGLGAAMNEVAEARVQWELHGSLAASGDAPVPTEDNLADTVTTPCIAAVDTFGAATHTLVTRVGQRLQSIGESFTRDVATVAEEALGSVDVEVARAKARTDAPDVATDKALCAAVVTVAAAGAAVSFAQGARTELVSAALMGGAASAAAGVMGRVATNARDGAPLLEGWQQAALHGLPGGLVAGLGGTVVAAPWLEDLAPRLMALIPGLDQTAWGIIARGLWQTGEFVLSQAAARACVAAAMHGMTTLRNQSLTGELFDTVTYGQSVGRHALEFALRDAREWLELRDDSHEATP